MRAPVGEIAAGSARRSRAWLAPIALGLTACGDGGPPPSPRPPMDVPLVVRDLLVRAPEWEVRRAHPSQAPEVDVICPSFRPGLDGADLLSLVMPPPSEVSFTVDEGDAPATLRMRAGVDLSAMKKLGPLASEGRFVFEVLVDGELAHHSTLQLEFASDLAGSEWQDVGGPGGIDVEPGDVVTLVTRAEDNAGAPIESDAVVYAGYGAMRLERRREIPRSMSTPDAPNVVVVVMDTLRRDRLSVYGYERPTSPNLERLAERGLVFEDAYAASSWTWPSTASILTGLQPEQHGVRDSSSCFLAMELETLPEAMQRAGLTTAGWSANPLISASRNFDQGFELFDDHVEFRRAGELFDGVVAWLEEWAGTRFFLYLHLTEPHRPFAPLPEGRRLLAPDVPDTAIENAQRIAAELDGGEAFDAEGRSRLDELVSEAERAEVSALYDACVWSGDHWLGRVMDELARLGLDDETIVVFTNDHGEELFERNWLGHSKSVYLELVGAPLVIAGPGVPAGARVAAPVSNASVAPYLAGLVGLTLHARIDADALLAGTLDTPVLYSTEKGFWNGFQNTRVLGMRWRDYSVQLAPEAGGWGGDVRESERLRLFDLAQDPEERRDLAGRADAPADAARAELERRFDALAPAFHFAEHHTGSGTARLLERVGYAGH